MFETIKNTYQQFLPLYEEGLKAGKGLGVFSHITLGAMGGSALPGDLVNDYLKSSFRIDILTDYSLRSLGEPKDTIFIAASFSGNTEETLSILEEAIKAKLSILILANGGALIARAKKDSIPFIQIPDCIQPRCAAGYFFGALLGVMEGMKLIPSQKEVLEGLVQFLKDEQSRQEDIGKKCASQLAGKVPIVYGPTELAGVCRIIKIKFNENSKIQSFYNTFPELNHNEMVGYTKMLMEPAILYLKGSRMHPRIYKRMDVLKELLSDRMPFIELELKGKNHLQEIWDAILIGDYASYYLAKVYGVDPAPVEMVESFKKKL